MKEPRLCLALSSDFFSELSPVDRGSTEAVCHCFARRARWGAAVHADDAIGQDRKAVLGYAGVCGVDPRRALAPTASGSCCARSTTLPRSDFVSVGSRVCLPTTLFIGQMTLRKRTESFRRRERAVSAKAHKPTTETVAPRWMRCAGLGFSAFQFQENPHAAVPLFTTSSLTNQSPRRKPKVCSRTGRVGTG
jgi:hypothetical protein